MKKLLLFILLYSIFLNNYGQSQGGFNPTLTYWYYKDRLKYFVIPGQNQGESEIISVRNSLNSSFAPNSLYGYDNQEQLHFGLYLGMLATQWALLYNDEQYDDAAITLTKIDNALYQFNTYLDKSDNWGGENQ